MNAQRSAGFAILLALAATFAQVRISSAPASPSQVARSPLQHAPMRLIGPAPSQWGRSDLGIYESDNWAGYAVVGSAFTEARGSWTVPSVNCRVNPNGAASFWVGIDGWDNNTVEQTGTESQCNGIELVTYAWYEFAPKTGVTIKNMRVTPGEDMEAEVHYKGSRFVVTIVDLTTGRRYRERNGRLPNGLPNRTVIPDSPTSTRWVLARTSPEQPTLTLRPTPRLRDRSRPSGSARKWPFWATRT